MSEIIQFLLEYPAWVKITIPVLLLVIFIILLFFHPVSATQTGNPSTEQKPTPSSSQNPVDSGNKENEQTEINSLVILLNTRSDVIISSLDGAIKALEDASSEDAEKTNSLRGQLETLKKQFLALHKEHIDAIQKNNIFLSHEINEEIQDVLTQMSDLVDSRVGEISTSWFGKLQRRYMVSPDPGTDPAYDSTQRDTAKLREDTVDRLRSVAYPGKLPESTSKEIAELVLGEIDKK
jgi:uncharacterized membrane protein YdfJ with MMPL/SSD domain